ncbi:LOW QUALITY PROTEIN: uncharacterized protein LOC135212471 [Macrobrachium nipponense]|uniref:LOW QUALITY PROTEIN: uncharacterized protein LOC135212471 n=1 Tax=Macrobrachium nipponense TaxID=159736 RepID=UPI0030C7BDB3
MKSQLIEEKSPKPTKTWTKQDKSCGLDKSTRSGLKVTVLWVTYVLMGSFAFIYLEQSTSVTSSEKDHHHWARFKELASSGDAVDELMDLRDLLTEICQHPRINQTYGWVVSRVQQHGQDGQEGDSILHNIKTIEVADGWWRSIEKECAETLRIIEHVTTTHYWSVVDSIYFTMTAVTTIGYGHIAPQTRYGRLFCVLYSLVGVPLTCILMAKSSDLLSNKMLQLYTTAKKKHLRNHKTLLYGITWIYLTVGFIVFMFIPSVFFVKLENWTYEDALYFTFITLSTIGFGDLIAGYNTSEWYSDAYKMAIVIWIMLALGYWFLLMNFLQKALKSNVPRKIKKTLHFKTKKMAKQAEFFRQLVGSVRRSQRKTSVVESEREVMALMAEVAGALTGEEGSRVCRPRSRKPSVRLDCTQAAEDSDCEVNTTFTLADLLDVNVVVRSDGVPTIRNLAAQSPQPIEEYSKSLHGMLKKSASQGDTQVAEESEHNQLEEVVLPLREVLQLVVLVASVEDQVSAEGTESTVSLQDEIRPRADTSSSLTSCTDTRESVPLLRDIFAGRQPANRLFIPSASNLNLQQKEHLLNHGEDKETEEVVNEQFDEFSEDEEDEESDSVASQIDLSCVDDSKSKDVESGCAYKR